MPLVTLPRQYMADIDGLPRVGALLSVYDAGTNNTRTAFTSKAYTTPLSQPIESVESGIFPAIYVDPEGGDYKITIHDENAVLIYSEDNIPVQDFTSETLSLTLDSLKRSTAEIAAGITPTNYAYFPGDARRYGAVGDGVSDDTAALANWRLSNTRLYLPPGTYLTGEINFSNRSDFSLEIDGTLVSNMSKPGAAATDMRATGRYSDCVLKFNTCSRFKVHGKGRIDNRYVQAIWAHTCTDFRISIDCISNGTNDNLPGIYVRFCSSFMFHDCTWDGIVLNPMNDATYVYYDWVNNIQVLDCSTYAISRVLSRRAAYAAVYVGSNCFDFVIDSVIAEFCAGTAFQFSWASFGVLPARYVVTNCIARYCQADGYCSDNGSGVPGSSMAVFSNNQAIQCGWRNGNPANPITADGSGIGTFQNVIDLTITGNTAHECSRSGVFLDNCSRVVYANNILFKSTGAQQGIYINDCTDVTVRGNIVIATALEALKLDGVSVRVTINDNTFFGPVSFPSPGGGVSYTDMTFTSNRVQTATGINAVGKWGDNKITYSGSGVAVVVVEENVTFDKDSIRAATTGAKGITITNIDGCAIENCSIVAASQAVVISGCDGTRIQANFMQSAAAATCELTGVCDRTVLTSNRFSNTGAANSLTIGASCTKTSRYSNISVAGAITAGGTFEINNA